MILFQLLIGPDDFGVMMGVLNENLPEGEEERKASAAVNGGAIQKAPAKTGR